MAALLKDSPRSVGAGSGRLRTMNTLHRGLGTPMNGSLEQQLEQVRAEAHFTEGRQRKRSADQLLVGAVSGLLGFSFAFLIGIIKEETVGPYDLNGNMFKSERGYFPSTVSEMVHDPQQPAGKVFFAFCFVGAVLIFFSWYPTMLRNVYIGDDTAVCGIAWVTWRQFIPAPGMMMLSIITTVPAAQATPTDQFCICLHLVGAAMLFVGYFVCEAHAVGWGPFNGVLEQGKLQDTKLSIGQRKWCLTGVGFFYSLFCIFQVVLATPCFDPAEYDQWGELQGHHGVHLIDTASGNVKFIKLASYASEVVCGLLLICSHLVIWYHCEERLYDLPEVLTAMRSRFNLESDEEQGGVDAGSDDDESDSE